MGECLSSTSAVRKRRINYTDVSLISWTCLLPYSIRQLQTQTLSTRGYVDYFKVGGLTLPVYAFLEFSLTDMMPAK